MAIRKTPKRVSGGLRPESDLSQVLAHGPAVCGAYGKHVGGFLMMIAIIKASRGPLGVLAVVSVLGTVAYRIWAK